MVEVRLDRLEKVYPSGVVALRDLNLTISASELLVLIGPSGCGKTTTLRLIAGLEAPTAGTIAIAGRVVNDLPPRARGVGMVFQKPAVYPHLTVRRNLELGLRFQAGLWGSLFRSQERAERVAEVAGLLHLGDVLDRRADQLSGGQQQRVALGRALARRPGVLLLDEPLSQLDAPLRAELRRELHLLHSRLAATMVYVTHDPLEALSLADRLAILDAGAVQQVGPPQEVYQRPVHRRVAELVGWPPMNFVEGRLIVVEGRPTFAVGADQLPVPAAWAVHAERLATLGLRPEGIRPAEGGLPMEAVLVEPLGALALVTLRRPGWQLVAQLPAEFRIMTGRNVPVTLNMHHAHLFDAASGLNLSAGADAG